METFALTETLPQELGTVTVVFLFIGFLKWAVDKVKIMIDEIHSHHNRVNDKLGDLIQYNTQVLEETRDATEKNTESNNELKKQIRSMQ